MTDDELSPNNSPRSANGLVDGAFWERQIEADVRTGKLDALAERALRDHADGRSRDL